MPGCANLCALATGAAKEAAVLAALRLLRRALEQDVELVIAMRQASHSGAILHA